jgi:hypothetical protein
LRRRRKLVCKLVCDAGHHVLGRLRQKDVDGRDIRREDALRAFASAMIKNQQDFGSPGASRLTP